MLFPITFIASTFVPAETLPGVLRTFAEWNPVTTLAGVAADPVRQPAPAPRRARLRGRCSTRSLYTLLIWIVAIIAVCAPLAVSRFQRSITD